MKLNLDFSELVRLAKRMLPEGGDFILSENIFTFDEIDVGLKDGIEINIGDLDSGTSLISYQGRQVLLYIRDHGTMYDIAVADPSKGNRFHIAWCRTLEDMRTKNRFERYHVTNSLDGLFEIDDANGRHQEVKLRVCKNCLERLNYRNSSDRVIKMKVFNTFVMKDFFAHYSTCFRHMPQGLFKAKNSGYVEGWKEISSKVRGREGYICSDCGVDMSLHRNLCDVHHKDGVKYHNTTDNLEVVCRDCHRKKPQHGGMYLSAAEMKIIQTCRLKQGINIVTCWDDVYSLTDTSLHGDIKTLETKGYPLPKICFQIDNNLASSNFILDAAWPAEKIAINLERTTIAGWSILTVGEVVAYFNKI